MFNKDSRTNTPVPATADVEETQEVRKPTISTTTAPRSTAVIGATVRVRGDIFSEENLIIEGLVEGTVSLNSHELTIGQNGTANANISAKIIKVDGRVQGDLIGKEKVIISKTGNMTGNISAPSVILEEGGKFKGSIDMGHNASAEGSLSGLGSVSKASRVAEPVKTDAAVVPKQG